MRRGVIITSPDAEAHEAASIMAKRKISGLPVVSEGKLIGIITTTDILHAFVRLSVKEKS
ncbi:MAG: CBS domain-containing protein [Nitrospirae bacterium]|nr:CBS domain-containing protein [Nitrospirota bacterium]